MLRQQLAEIPAIGPSRHERLIIDTGNTAACPTQEVRRVVVERAHPARRDIQQVALVLGRVRDALARQSGSLVHDDP
jgi:hypothetical protein